MVPDVVLCLAPAPVRCLLTCAYCYCSPVIYALVYSTLLITHCPFPPLPDHSCTPQRRSHDDGEDTDTDAENEGPTETAPDTKKKNSRLCSECASRVAIRACNECGDKFCTKCYKFLHSTGNGAVAVP